MGGRGEAQEGWQEDTEWGPGILPEINSFKYIDKLDGQTMKFIEELCETLLRKLVIS